MVQKWKRGAAHREVSRGLIDALSRELRLSYWGEAVGSICATILALPSNSAATASLTVVALPILLPLLRDVDRLNQVSGGVDGLDEWMGWIGWWLGWVGG